MRRQLQEYLDILQEHLSRTGAGAGYTALKPDLAPKLRHLEPTVKEVLRSLDPALANFDFDFGRPERQAAVYALQRGLGILDKQDEWVANLVPDAPYLPADRFHPWVWSAAQTLWETKHYREAVEAAAKSINAHTQTKVGRRDKSDTDLMNLVLTADRPKPGQPYLQLPGDPTDLTIKDRNRALRPFAEGCFAGIRNPAAHEHGPDWSEQIALEYLAALSVLARWIDGCQLKHHP